MPGENNAGPSRPNVAKDEKKSTKRKRNTPTTTPTPPVPGNPSLPSKSKAERNKEKYQEWRQRKRQRDRAPQHVDIHPSPSSIPPITPLDPAKEDNDMTVEIMFTTSTGKIVTAQNVGTILTGYLQAFQKDPAKHVARYKYTLIPPTDINKKWKPDPNNAHQPPPDSLHSCKVIMPPGIEPEYVTSTAPGFRSKALAKRDAMSVMVQKLLEAGQISQDLVSTPSGSDVKTVGAKDRKDLKWFGHQEKLGKITDPSTAVEGATLNERWASFKKGLRDRLPTMPESSYGRKGTSDCVPITSPTFWEDLPPFTSTTEFYPTSITLQIEGNSDECRTMCLLTTRPLPDMELMREIDLTIREKEVLEIKPVKAKANLRDGPAMTKLSGDQLESAFAFTRSVLSTHLAHPVIGGLDECRWLLLPMRRDFDPTKHTKIRRRDIDWDQIELGTSGPTPCLPEHFASVPPKSICDAMFGTADSSRLVYIQPSSHPETPFDAFTALPGRKGGFVNELSSTRNPLPHLRELKTRHYISASVYRTTSMLPAIFDRIDAILIARQASENIFDSAINTSEALLALTPRKTSGDLPCSYERLEFLGDTLLKLIGTVDVFARPPSVLSKVEVEKERHLMLSNRMLHKCGEEAGITPYIRNMKFKASHWRPAGWRSEVGPVVEEPTQTLGLKVVADVVEAFIGAAYLSQSRTIDSAIKAVLDLHIPLVAIRSWSNAAAAAVRDAQPPAPDLVAPAGWLGALTKPSLKVLGYTFKDPRRGQVVLNRSPDPGVRDTAVRYKLLGNALLEYFVVEGIWDKYPHAGPPAMTTMKHSRVSDMNLSAFCALTPVFDQLTGIPHNQQASYRKYRNLVKAAKDLADREIEAAGPLAMNDELSEVGKDWWSDIPHTHICNDILDGLVGAVLVDSGYDIDRCRIVYAENFLPYMDKYCHGPHEEGRHPKDLLHKIIAQRKCQHFSIRRDNLNPETNDFDAAVIIHDTEVGKGSGPWQELAVRRACTEVMKKFRGDMYWIEGICDCQPKV